MLPNWRSLGVAAAILAIPFAALLAWVYAGAVAAPGGGAIGRVGAEVHHAVPMDLIQKNSPGTRRGGLYRRLQPTAVGIHGGPVVAHVGAQVQTVARCAAHATAARGAQGMHSRWRGPIRCQPVRGRQGARRVHGQASLSGQAEGCAF